MQGEAASAGPRDVQEHIALMIANDPELSGQPAGHRLPR